MCSRWVATVRRDTNSRSAICRLVSPMTARSTTFNSVGVRLSQPKAERRAVRRERRTPRLRSVGWIRSTSRTASSRSYIATASFNNETAWPDLPRRARATPASSQATASW